MIKDIDGISVNYEVKGSGSEYVFILHGWGANIGVYTSVSDLLSQKFTVVSLDFPGFGGTPEPPDVWSVSDYADFTVKFISSFGVKNVILFGHSFGGRVIIKMASLPELSFNISKIIFADSAGVMPVRGKSRISEQKFTKRASFSSAFILLESFFPRRLSPLEKSFLPQITQARRPLCVVCWSKQ